MLIGSLFCSSWKRISLSMMMRRDSRYVSHFMDPLACILDVSASVLLLQPWMHLYVANVASWIFPADIRRLC